MNKFYDGAQPTIWESFITATANSLCGLASRLLLQDELFSYYWWPHRFTNMVTMNHAAHFMVHSIWADLLHELWTLSIRIHRPKHLDSQFQVNEHWSYIKSLVTFSGQGEKLLERNKRLGHNLRQHGIQTDIEYRLNIDNSVYHFKHT